MKNVVCIIPTYNEEQHISPCIMSLLSQSYPAENMEILVVDGGSTDRTEAIVKDIASRYDNVRLIHNPRKIQASAFNIGVENSSSDYILRFDAHAYYEETYIERCVINLENNPDIGNVGGRCIIKPASDSPMARANAILNRSRFGIGNSDFRVGTIARATDTVPFGAFRRSCIEEIGGMREDLPRGEDNEYNSRIRKAGYLVWFNPEIVSTYFARPTLKSSAKQMYENGVSIARLLKLDRNAVKIRHMIPLFFLVSIPLTGGISLIIYILATLLACLIICKDEGFEYFLPLAALFPAIHFSYGWGTLYGLLKH